MRHIGLGLIVGCLCASTAFAQPERGDSIFFNNFNNGNFTGLTPWVGGGPATYDASSGDLVITPLGGPFGGIFLNSDLTDVSFITRARGGDVGIWVRGSNGENVLPTDTTSYFARLFPSGDLSLTLNVQGADTILGRVNVPFDISQQDVMLRLDVLDVLGPGRREAGLVRTALLNVWAWLPDDQMPVEPLLTAMDMTWESGSVGLFSETTATYGFVDVAVALPEPTTIALLTVGLGGGLLSRRRRPV